MIYRFILAPLLKAFSASPSGCRYLPSCSHYTEESIRRFGLFHGTFLGLRRISKCHPWSTRDVWDPVPESKQNLKVKVVCCS